jgi:signal transduction histidine kinase
MFPWSGSCFRALLLLCFLSGHGLTAHAQDRVKDSAAAAYRKAGTSSEKLTALFYLANHSRYFATDTAIHYAYMALNLAKETHNLFSELDAHFELAFDFQNRWQLDSSRRHYDLAEERSVQAASPIGQSRVYSHKGEFYEAIGKRDSSLFCHLKALELAEKSGYVNEKASTLAIIAKYYTRQHEYAKALPYGLESLHIWEKADSSNTAGVLSDIGNIYYGENNFPKALEYYQAAYKKSRSAGDLLGYGYSLNNIGLVYMAEKDYGRAISYYLQSMKYYRMDLNKIGLANTAGNLANAYFQAGNMSLSQQYAKESISWAKQVNDKAMIAGDYDILARTYEKLGDYSQAYHYMQQRSIYSDSVHSADIARKVTDIQTHYEISQKEAENKALKADRARQDIYIQRQKQLGFLISVILLLSIFITFVIYRASRHQQKNIERLEQQKELIEDKNIELERLNRETTLQKQELEKANRFRDKMFSIISHDFRSPLISLQGVLYMLKENAISQEELRIMSGEIIEQVNVTSDFLENLLNWAQSQMQGYKPFIRPIDLYITVEELFYLFKTQARHKNIELLNEIPRNLEIMADANMIKLVLRNFISNAIKFTTEGSVTVRVEQAENQVVLSVQDTGKGIPEEIRDKLFSSDGYTTPGTANERGTGLGLTLCREFVEINGGSVRIESKMGEGSTFSFSIPLKEQMKPASETFYLA